MIKVLLKPFLKKYIGLFFSMVFVSMLSIALLIAFASSISNLTKSYKNYREEYGAPNVTVKTKFQQKNKYENLSEIEGVSYVDYRLTIDFYMKRSDGRTITTRINSFNEEDEYFYRRYVHQKGELDSDRINISVARKFAENNNFKVGDKVKFGLFNVFVEANIYEIVDTVEVIYTRAADYIMSDSFDFGYVYVSEQELNKAIERLSSDIKQKISEDETYKEYYEKAVSVLGEDVPDIGDLNFDNIDVASKFCNLIFIEKKDGYSDEEVLQNVLTYLEEENVPVVQSSIQKTTIYDIYLQNSFRQLRIGSIFLPVFFFIVTAIVIILFINQIVKSMTSQIGTMMSIGVAPTDIMAVFQAYTLIMSFVSTVLGIGGAYGITYYLCSTFSKVYSIPTITYKLDFLWVVIAIACLWLMIQMATVISCQAIFKITPKDAMISNEAKRKNLPKWLDRIIEKSPMNIKLGLNSIAQNPKRFIVSTFAMFAAFMLIMITSLFSISKDELIRQSLQDRLPFDCQIYASKKTDEEFLEKLESQEFVVDVNDCYFTYLEVEGPNKKEMLETLAYDVNDSNLIFIPGEKGASEIKPTSDGIILSVSEAKALGVGVGDIVTINGSKVTVSNISNQYYHMTEYISKSLLDELGVNYVSSFLVNVKDQQALLDYLSGNENKCLIVFSSNIKEDLTSMFKPVNTFIIILNAFAITMGLVILAIMTQNALMEQRRPISVMRSIGFRIMNISNLWTLQSLSELVFSTLLAIPGSILVISFLLSITSSEKQIYPFVFRWKETLVCFAFIFGVILATHIYSMLSIKRWNLADNTRTRE